VKQPGKMGKKNNKGNRTGQNKASHGNNCGGSQHMQARETPPLDEQMVAAARSRVAADCEKMVALTRSQKARCLEVFEAKARFVHIKAPETRDVLAFLVRVEHQIADAAVTNTSGGSVAPQQTQQPHADPWYLGAECDVPENIPQTLKEHLMNRIRTRTVSDEHAEQCMQSDMIRHRLSMLFRAEGMTKADIKSKFDVLPGCVASIVLTSSRDPHTRMVVHTTDSLKQYSSEHKALNAYTYTLYSPVGVPEPRGPHAGTANEVRAHITRLRNAYVDTPTSIDEMATTVSEVRDHVVLTTQKRAAKGPVLIWDRSDGGVIAIEIVQALDSKNDQVKLVFGGKKRDHVLRLPPHMAWSDWYVINEGDANYPGAQPQYTPQIKTTGEDDLMQRLFDCMKVDMKPSATD
jgi:hypothetical protein